MTDVKTGQQNPATATSQDLGKSGHFGPRLRLARKEKGWTLKDLSAASGISVTYLSDLERGKLQNPTLDTITSLADAMGMSMNSLLGISESDNSEETLPPALVSFCDSHSFKEAALIDAERLKVPVDLVVDEWKRLLRAVSVFDASPATETDYDYIFQTVRRVLS